MKGDNNRIARATGATIVHRVEELKEEDIGTGAGLFKAGRCNSFTPPSPRFDRA